MRPFTKEHRVKLMTKVLNHPELSGFNAATWDRMLRLTECSEAVMGNFAKRVVTVLRGKHVLGGLLNAYVSKLGEDFIRCLPEEAKHLDAATLEYTLFPMVSRGEKMLYSGIDPESYITEKTTIHRRPFVGASQTRTWSH